MKNKIKHGLHKYYKSVINSLEDMLKCPGIAEKCKDWSGRKVPDGTYADIYDGKVWKEFMIPSKTAR